MRESDRYPNLYQLFAGGFNQDWDRDVGEGGDWTDVIDEFVEGQGLDEARGALRELDQVLATDADDDALRATVLRLDSYYCPDTGEARSWLTAIRDRLAAATG